MTRDALLNQVEQLRARQPDQETLFVPPSPVAYEWMVEFLRSAPQEHLPYMHPFLSHEGGFMIEVQPTGYKGRWSLDAEPEGTVFLIEVHPDLATVTGFVTTQEEAHVAMHNFLEKVGV